MDGRFPTKPSAPTAPARTTNESKASRKLINIYPDFVWTLQIRCGSVCVNKRVRRNYTRVSTKNMKGNMIMQTEKKTKISSVHFKYVGTDEQYNAFIKSVIKDYITDDSLLPDTEEEIIVTQKSA